LVCRSKKRRKPHSACAGVSGGREQRPFPGCTPVPIHIPVGSWVPRTIISLALHPWPCVTLQQKTNESWSSSRRGGRSVPCVNMWSSSPIKCQRRGGGCHIGVVCCRRGSTWAGRPGWFEHLFRPLSGGLLPPAGEGPHAAAATGLLSPPRPNTDRLPTGGAEWVVPRDRHPKSGFALLTRLASECVNPLGLRTPDGNSQNRNKENTNIQGPAPLPFLPRPFMTFCPRQSPAATFIEGVESRDHQPDAALASRTLSSKDAGQRKGRFTDTASPLERQYRFREQPGCIGKEKVH
jgi:hypothetical protein